MGLAASQARFLCITARKADCEYKSTALAQEKLDITKQLSDISTNYAQAMNATKLIWQNDGLANDYGVTYSLLMMPTAANDFNPYMITSPSGAIVLNSEYAAAAKAAGISKAGGVGSQQSRDKFIAALSHQGLITEPTADEITRYDYKIDKNNPTDVNGKLVFTNEATVAKSDGLDWNPVAGMGADPLDKSGAEAVTLPQLLLSESIGQVPIDWAKMFVTDGQMTENEYMQEKEYLNDLIATVIGGKVDKAVVDQLKRDYNNFKANPDVEKGSKKYNEKCAEYEDLIFCAENVTSTQGGYIMKDGELYKSKVDGSTTFHVQTVFSKIETHLKDKLTALDSAGNEAVDIAKGNKINVSKNSLTDSGAKYSVVQDGIINHYADEIKGITLADIISGNVVLMTEKSKQDVNNPAESFKNDIMKLLDSMVATLGYSKSDDLYGKGLYVDDASRDALKFAYEMIEKTYLRTNDSEIQDVGSRGSSKSMTENSAYLNAINSNRIGSLDGGSYYAVSLSNMMSSFLTYYENALSGINSPYVVGTTVETSEYVTDNLGYYYMAQTNDDAVVSVVSKSADFYDQVYNNILEHGWREDSAIDDAEYLEAALKDGRYSMSSLNQDGYYYQTRYNETGYMVEVSDTDAIERAEAEFSSMKAQLTYKEDTIDLKTKKLDAEISSLSTEYDTVKNLISKSIEKTFALFQN